MLFLDAFNQKRSNWATIMMVRRQTVVHWKNSYSTYFLKMLTSEKHLTATSDTKNELNSIRIVCFASIQVNSSLLAKIIEMVRRSAKIDFNLH